MVKNKGQAPAPVYRTTAFSRLPDGARFMWGEQRWTKVALTRALSERGGPPYNAVHLATGATACFGDETVSFIPGSYGICNLE